MRKFTASLLCAALLMTGVAYASEPRSVIPGGHTLGVKLFCEGLLVVGMAPVETENGKENPALDAGLASGDIITHINESPVSNITELQALVAKRQGDSIEVKFQRGGHEKVTTLKPKQSKHDGAYKIGAWVRDSMAGIGTITFYDPSTGLFGALGHGINDADTGLLLPMSSGHVLYSEVESVRIGQPGSPGELKGTFRNDKAYGKLMKNTENGIFGVMPSGEALGPDPQKPCETGTAKEGPATILSNIAGDEVLEYKIDIVKLYDAQGGARNFMIQVTDPALITATGGIVQGMSGSPIMQNGKLVGAVTHVLVNDPKRGYGIFIESMLKDGEAALEAETLADAA